VYGELVAKIFFAWGPVHIQLALLDPVSHPIKMHIHGVRSWMFHCVISNVVCGGLIGSNGVASFMCPTSSNVTQICIHSLELTNVVPNSAYDAEDITCLSIVHTLCIWAVVFLPAGVGCLPKQKCPLSLLCALEAERYNASLWL
jgi:hypothetical protein